MRDKASFGLGVVIMILSAAAIISAWDWPLKAKLFPLVIAIPLFCLAATEVLWALFGAAAQGQAQDFQLSDHVPRDVMLRRTALAAGWILGFFALILLLGFLAAVPLFVFLYLKGQGRERWVFSAVFTLVVWGFFYGLFDVLLHLPFPAGWIATWAGIG